MISNKHQLQSFKQLFFLSTLSKQADDLSVYSPSAYLVDLVQLLDDKLPNEYSQELNQRRKDIKADIELTAENTYTSIPYLDIVNRILETKIPSATPAKSAKYPFNLPFNFENERIKKFLSYLDIILEDLYKIFIVETDENIVAREYLKLSQEEYDVFKTDLKDNDFSDYWGGDFETLQKNASVANFLNIADISGEELLEILYQNLSRTAKQKEAKVINSEIKEARNFFTNNNKGSVKLDERGEILIWEQNPQPSPGFKITEQSLERLESEDVPNDVVEILKGIQNQEATDEKEFLNLLEKTMGEKQTVQYKSLILKHAKNPNPADEILEWFKRVNLFIRLAKKTAISFSDLDLILRSCCENNINEKSIQIIATVKSIHKQYEIPIDVVCSLLSDINILGIGDSDEPQDLFNRIFNVKLADIDKKYISAPELRFIPDSYSDYMLLPCSGDILSLINKEYRKRLCQALYISEKELIFIVERFRSWSADKSRTSLLDIQDQPEKQMNLSALSLLFRLSKLSELLELPCSELLNLLDILNKDSLVNTNIHNFKVLINYSRQEQDCYQIIQGKNDDDLLWLIQLLLALVKWMQANDFTEEELKLILLGKYNDEKIKETNRSQKIAHLNNIHQQFKPFMFSSELLESETFDSRSAGILYDVVTEEKNGLVSRYDNRILTGDFSSAKTAFYDALNQFDVIVPEDFTRLSFGAKILDKIFNNLIIHEYINAEGSLNEEKFSLIDNNFTIETDFYSLKTNVFSLIQNLLVDEIEFTKSNNELDDNDNNDQFKDIYAESMEFFHIYPSDLASVENLTAPQRNELYDNLVFNGYIDESGKVLQADFFTLEENVNEFKINVDIIDASVEILELITEQTEQFAKKDIILTKNNFADPMLKEYEIDNLIENLRFNDYLDENNRLQNKEELLNLDVKDFNLALAFYPNRHKILTTIKELIGEFKSQLYTFSRETFTNPAEYIAGQWIYEDLFSQYQGEGYPESDRDTFFLEPEQLPELSLRSYFSADDAEIVSNTIDNIINLSHRYRFATNVLEELYFEKKDQDELIQILQENNFLLETGIIPEHKLGYFLNIDNALTFNLGKFEDHNKDIFFVLHAIAKEIDDSLNEVVLRLQDLAHRQADILFFSLQDVFSIHAETIKVLCQRVFNSPNNKIIEEFFIPILSVVDSQDRITLEPNNNKFNMAYRRIQQFSLLISKLGLTAAETQIVFDDQNLVEKFPENLILPETIKSIDALIESPEGIIYLFKDKQYWAYSADTYNLLDQETLATILVDAGYSEDYVNEITKNLTIDSLSEKFAELAKIDAAFVDHNGKSHIIAQDRLYTRDKGRERWIEQEKEWGKIDSNFDELNRLDAAFQDKDGKTYLFVENQYIRYSEANYDFVDPGYPLMIAANWQRENFDGELPDKFKESFDAAFQGTNDKKYLFKEQHFICSDQLSQEMLISARWGKVKNNFASATSVDAAYTDGSRVFVLLGDQLVAYQNSVENDQVTVAEGFPIQLKSYYQNLSSEFTNGVDAALKGTNGKIYHFKDDKVAEFVTGNGTAPINEPQDTQKILGKVRNTIIETGTIDAAFVGLDGKTYLFSGDQYFRYSGKDYRLVDDGFPRTIKDDWGGLEAVDAAFILDGKTYLFGKVDSRLQEPRESRASNRLTRDQENQHIKYVRYSTNDYTEPDDGYPKVPNDNWWNLPFELVQKGAVFNQIDAILTAEDGKTYLFSNHTVNDSQFIYFDRQQRWWSEPASLKDYWDSIPFDSVNAAFTGKDGKTYLFSGEEFVRYSGVHYNQVDDRYPNITNRYWGNVVNNIAETGKVEAALVVESIDEKEQPATYTYLFSGNQYVRYTDIEQEFVDEGYPKYIATSLKEEPRFKHLDFKCDDGIDAAFADRRNIYIFKHSQLHVISSELSATYHYADLGLDRVGCAFIDKQGNLFIEDGQWHHMSSLEGMEVQKTQLLPYVLRKVPSKFQSGLNTVLQGVDRNTYLFKDKDCFNVSLDKEYPLAEEWGRVTNNIEINGRIDAAFVGRNGKTYLFSGDQFVVYEAGQDGYADDKIEGHPQLIESYWGGLTHVNLAFVQEGRTYLFEKPDAEGNMLTVCYSTEDYRQADAGFPKTTNLAFLEIPQTYIDDGFTDIEAVLFEGDNMFLLNQEEYSQFNKQDEQWTCPKPLDRIWRGFHELDNDKFKGVKAAFTGRDGVTYFFSDEYYVGYQEGNVLGAPTLIKKDWGIIDNHFVNQDSAYQVDAAFVFQDKITYLFSGDQYVRYSTEGYCFVDEGYPKLIAESLLEEECFKNAPAALAETIDLQIEDESSSSVIDAIVSNDQNLYIFIANQCYVVSQSLTRVYDLEMIGKVKNNLVDDYQVDAALVNREAGQTFIFSGDQYVRYSDDSYEYADDGYPKAIKSLVNEEELPNLENEAKETIAEFIRHGIDAAIGDAGNDNVYLFKDKEYLSFKDPSAIAINNQDADRISWGKIDNPFTQAGDDKIVISAAFISSWGQLYLFKGDQYIRYSDLEQEFIDAGFPKPIKDNWGNLPNHPINFEAGIDGAFVFEGKTYFLKGDDYVRYADSTYQLIDRIYPQKFKHRWGDWADYLLSDLKILVQFKRLQETFNGGDYTLIDFFHGHNGAVTEPYQMLSDIFGWDVDEVKWLKRHNGFLRSDNLFEVAFNLELIIKFFEVFYITDKMGTSPSELYKEVWQKMYPPTELRGAADALYKLLALLHQ